MNAQTLWIGMIALAAAGISHGQSYTVADLGVAPGSQMSTGAALNAKGQAVGTSSDTSGGSGVATLFSGGSAQSLGTFGAGDATFAEAISPLGNIAGYIYNSSAGQSHAFLDLGGRLSDINDAALFPAGSDGIGVNDSGQVCGYGWPTTAGEHAFLYSNGATTDLGTLGGSISAALGINDSGSVVGQAMNAAGVTHGFLYVNGHMTDLGVPSGYTLTTALAISSNGLILGELQTSNATHTGVFQNGAWTDVASGVTNPASSGALPAAINGSGAVVGSFVIPGIYSPRSKRRPARSVAAILHSGTYVDLNTMIPANSGYQLLYARGINDSGQILCDAIVPGGASHAVLLTPQ